MSAHHRYISLTDLQRSELLDGYKTGKKSTYRQRCHIILLSDKGKTIDEIAEIMDVTRQTIGNWFSRYEELGCAGLHTATGGGRPPIFRINNQQETERIKAIVAKHPQQLKQAIPEIEKELNKSFSKETLKRFLKKTIGPTND